MQFTRSVLTVSGESLIDRAIAAKGRIIWGECKTTSTNYANSTDDTLKNLTTFNDTTSDGVITSSIFSDSEKSVTLHAELTNKTASGFARAFGIWAKLEGDADEVLAFVAETGKATATYVNNIVNGFIRIFIDVGIYLSGQAKTAVVVDASNYAQADALAKTNEIVENLQIEERVKIYPSIMHAAAVAKNGDSFIVRRPREDIEDMIIPAGREVGKIESILPDSQIVDGYFLVKKYTGTNDTQSAIANLKDWMAWNFSVEDAPELNLINLLSLKTSSGKSGLWIASKASTQGIKLWWGGTSKNISLPESDIAEWGSAFGYDGILLIGASGKVYWCDNDDGAWREKPSPLSEKFSSGFSLSGPPQIGLFGGSLYAFLEISKNYEEQSCILIDLEEKKDSVTIATGGCRILNCDGASLIFQNGKVCEISNETEIATLFQMDNIFSIDSIWGVSNNGILAKKTFYSWRGNGSAAAKQSFSANEGVSFGGGLFPTVVESGNDGSMSLKFAKESASLNYSLCRKIHGMIVPIVSI